MGRVKDAEAHPTVLTSLFKPHLPHLGTFVSIIQKDTAGLLVVV